jgi:PadR family transcriptional regulator
VSDPSLTFLQGSLDGLVLKTLSWAPMHGFGVARWIREITDDALRLEEGTLYPALYRMENRGWIRAEWRLTENNRRAKYYQLTTAGRRRLAHESRNWARFADAVAKVFAATEQPV